MLLVIETATAACSVSVLGDDGTIIAEAHDVVGRGHAERLIPMIAALPGGGRADAIAVDCGPGSFTGVRVGLAAARALGLGWGVPVRGFSSMALIAADAPGDAASVAVAITGGHGELFVQRFSAGPLAEAGPLMSLTPEDAARVVGDVLVIGSGAEALVAARGTGEARAWLPRAAAFALLPLALAALPATPIYGRAPDAKVVAS